MLSKILASDRAFSDFEGPLFERATIEVRETVRPDGTSSPDPTSAKLILPDIQSKDTENVSQKFQITVKKKFEDNQAMVKTYQFTFQVTDIKFEPLGNGMVKPRFKAELKDYQALKGN
jgi:hypothetical protein